MRRRWFWLACAGLSAAVALGPPAAAGRQGAPALPRPVRMQQREDGLAVQRAVRVARTVPGRAIIELAGEPLAGLLGGRAPAADLAARRASIRAQHDRVTREMARQGLPFRVLHRYEAAYNGLAVELREADWPAVRAIPGVVAIYPETRRNLALEHSAAYAGARAVATGLGGTGRGVTVGIIDTGIDYRHPDLGGNGYGEQPTVYPTARVVGGHDFVGDEYTGCGDPLKPDEDPMDLNGHGSHVAGIVGAAAAGEGGLTGMAPEVTFRAYKVFGADGDTCTSTVVAAIDQAVADGVQVMNLSLGSVGGTETDPDSRAINNAARAGVTAAISAGNSGPNAYTIGSPGAARHALTVGAFTDDGVTTQFGNVVGDQERWTMIQMHTSGDLPEGGLTAPYVDVGYGFEQDYANKDLAGKVALIRRGYITFGEKARRAQDHGAVAALIFNNRAGDLNGYIAPDWGVTIPAYGLRDTAGARLLAALAADPGARVYLDATHYPFPDQKAGFTSIGPTNRFHWIKPDFAAPGVDVNSTVPYEPYYDSYSGTSMAAPHVAGAAAILKQLHPDWTPFDIKAALANTARVMQDSLTGETWPVMAQGAGMIRVDLAATTPIRAYSLSQGPGEPDAPSFSFGRYPTASSRSLTQQGLVLGEPGTRLAYSVEWVGAHPGVELRVWGDPHVSESGRARFAASLRLNGRVDKPEGVYGGYIWIATDRGSKIHLPFAVVLFQAG